MSVAVAVAFLQTLTEKSWQFANFYWNTKMPLVYSENLPKWDNLPQYYQNDTKLKIFTKIE